MHYTFLDYKGNLHYFLKHYFIESMFTDNSVKLGFKIKCWLINNIWKLKKKSILDYLA